MLNMHEEEFQVLAAHVLTWREAAIRPLGYVTASRVMEVGVAWVTSTGACRPRTRKEQPLLMLVSK